jgi:hypothetical protein
LKRGAEKDIWMQDRERNRSWKKMNNEQLRDFNSSYDFVQTIKTKRRR